MSQTVDAGVKPPPARDERFVRRSLLSRLLTRPEVGALRTSWLRLPAGAGELWHAECAEADGIDGG